METPLVTPLRRLALAGLLVLAIAASPGAVAATPSSVSLEVGGQKVVLPGLEEEGRTYVSVRAVATALNARLDLAEEGRARLVAPGGLVVFDRELPSLARVKGSIVSLSARALWKDTDLFVPVESAGRVFGPVESPDEAAARGPGEGVPTTLGVVGQGNDLRLVIEADTPLTTTLTRRGGDLLMRFGDGVKLLPPYLSRKFGGGLLDEVFFEQAAGGTELRLVPGAGFRTARLQATPGSRRAELILTGDPSARARLADFGRRAKINGVRRIVIDPGHGGAEEGAVSPRGVLEKDLTLQVSRRLRGELEALGFEVILTREEDRDLGLDERAAIANNQRADLFISVHANASTRTAARGAETYFLAREATDDEARTTAALENDAARLGDQREPEGLELVLWELAQVEYLEESADLAETIQRELNQALGLADRGVRQAPFRVLMGATMPAVLVEMGFLTHPEESRLLADPAHQDKLARAVARAVDSFRGSYQRRLGLGEARRVESPR